MCARCRRETLPQLPHGAINPNSVHRGKNSYRVEKSDPRAERIKARKERKREKAELRQTLRHKGIIATAKVFLLRQAENQSLAEIASEECERCLKIKNAVAA